LGFGLIAAGKSVITGIVGVGK